MIINNCGLKLSDKLLILTLIKRLHSVFELFSTFISIAELQIETLHILHTQVFA